MTGAGRPLRHCPRHHLPYRTGGVCLLAVPAESGTGRAGIAVSRAAHNLLPQDRARCGTCAGMGQVMTTALRASGCLVTPVGPGGAWLVAGDRDDDAGAGR